MRRNRMLAAAESRTLHEEIKRWLLRYFIEDHVPVEFFGKDHWSTFAYAESVCVDYRGVLDPPRMRCNTRLHRIYAARIHSGTLLEGKDYPTRLRHGIELPNHDDWSCLQDLQRACLLRIIEERLRKLKNGQYRAMGETQPDPGIFPHLTCRVELTRLGVQVASALRDHKAHGGVFASFQMPLELRGNYEAGDIASAVWPA